MAQSPVIQESLHYDESLAQSRSVSSPSSYSSNSFESVTDKSSRNYESDSFESITNDSSGKYESDSFESITSDCRGKYESDSFESITNDSSRKYESDSFESVSSKLDLHRGSEDVSSMSEAVEYERNDQGKALIEKWIKILVDRRLQPSNSSRHQFKTVAQEGAAENESNALRSYCSIKIQQLCQPTKTQRQNKQHPRTHPRGPAGIQPSCCVPHELMNRLRLQSFKDTMKQVMQLEMHEPASCPDCCNKQAQLAQCQFVRMRKTQLEADLLQQKMEEYTYSKDLVTCIGEIHQSLPKPSDECSAIWQRLYTSVKKT